LDEELIMPRRKAHRHGGRPCRLNVAVALDLVGHVGRGEPLEDAARLAGIGPTTLGRWRAAGRAGDPRFVALVEAIDSARSGIEGGLRRRRPSARTRAQISG
jgi:hypothetical protein